MSRHFLKKTSYKIAHHAKKSHDVFAKTPHKHLINTSKHYRAWHSWQWKRFHHGHVHGMVAASWAIVAVLFVSSNIGSVYAVSTWSQSDWSGGTGTSTTNQYESATNIDTTSSGQLSLDRSTEMLSNTGFNDDLSSWKSLSSTSTYNTAQKYSGAGSAQLTANGSTALSFNNAVVSDSNVGQTRIDSGDINGDGLDDVVTTTKTGIAVHLSNGDGTISAATAYDNSFLNYSYDIRTLDYDKDGDIDVVASYTSSIAFYQLYTNDGSGNLTRQEFALPGGGLRMCAIGVDDFDNNDWPDIAFTCYTSAGVHYALNTTSGGFSAIATVSLPANMGANTSIQTGDINGDGNIDVITNSVQNTCDIWYSLGTGAGLSNGAAFTYNECGTTNGRHNGMGGGDYNGDGIYDIVIGRRSGTGGTATSDSRYATVLFGNADTVFTGQLDLNGPTGMGESTYTDFVSQDFNGDGNLDFVSTTGTNPTAHLYLGDGTGSFAARENYNIGLTLVWGVTSADLLGDGRHALIASKYDNPSIGKIAIFTNRSVGDTITQPVDLDSEDIYQIEGYVRNSDGSPVTSADAQLFATGEALATTYEETATAGWYRVTAVVAGSQDFKNYGVIAKQSKTLFVDDMSLYKYAVSGTLTSAIYDLTFGGDWDTLTYTLSGASTAEVKVRTDSSSDMSGAADFSTCPVITSGSDLTGETCINNNDQYVQYQVTLNNDGGNTPIFEELFLNYDPWDTDPPATNASNITMQKTNGGNTIASNGWTNGSSPYFAWDSGTDTASGVKGYCLYLGTDNSADPVSTKGLLGSSPLDTDGACEFAVPDEYVDFATAGYINTALTTSNSPYYLNIKVIDVANNVFTGSNTQFQFRFDNTPPSNPAYLSAPSSYINTKSATLTWPTSGGDAASDAHSGVAGMQYRINSNNWYGDSHTGDGDMNDLLTDDGSYTTTSPDDPDETDIEEGVNLVYLRTWDQAGNTSTASVSAALKVNTSSAPSTPLGVTANPITNTANAFSFDWSQPANFSGSASNLTYCYTINVLPSSSSCTFTAAGVTELSEDSFATQPGENTFYVVAKDEAGNINYSNRGEVSFFANTPAPGIATNVDILDASVKSTNNWRLAITWDEPTDTGTGIASYKVYRSTDNATFTLAGSSTSTSFVDSGLNQQTYYYRVRACDSANQCSANSATVSELPTGKFTEPANIVSKPTITNVTTKRARISWSTDRESDSKISIGTQSGKYADSEIGNSNQVTSHTIDLDNLAAGTTYYLKAKWTDEDGNTGSSQEFTFTTSPAPLLKEVETLKVNLSGATIRFTTKSATKAILYYGKSESFGGAEEINTALAESTYSIGLEGLDDGSKYLFKIGLFDSEGGEYESSIFSFETPPRPRITNLRFQPVENQPTSTQKVSWVTNVPTTSGLTYGQVGTNGVDILNNELKTQHSITIKELADDSEYFLLAQGRDADGNLATSDRQLFKTALDTRPPSVSDIVVEASIRGSGAEARGQVIVSWKTDEPATSQVAYAEGSNASSFNNRTAEDATLTTEHLVIISDLQTSKAYTIMPVSNDSAQNPGEGSPTPAIIGRASESVLNIVLDTLRKVFGL